MGEWNLNHRLEWECLRIIFIAVPYDWKERGRGGGERRLPAGRRRPKMSHFETLPQRTGSHSVFVQLDSVRPSV